MDPATGNLAADSQQDVTVHFNAAAEGITTGVYHATLRYISSDPVNPLISLPVTMNVVVYDLKLEVDADSKVGIPGGPVVYNLTITNTSVGMSDSFDLSLLPGFTFPSNLSTATTPVLDPGESATFQVRVNIPANAMDGDQDSVIVRAAFHSKPDKTASIELTTTASIPEVKIFLPMITKR